MPIHGWKISAAQVVTIIVLVGSVGTAAAWQYRQSRSRDLLETVKDDLRNLAAAQEGYAADHGGSFMPPNSNVTTTTQYHGYAPSAGVIVNVAEPGSGGWSATATHERAPDHICGIYVGGAPPGPPNPATAPGQPSCN